MFVLSKIWSRAGLQPLFLLKLCFVIAALLVLQQLLAAQFPPGEVRNWVCSLGHAAPAAYLLLYATAPVLFFPASVLSGAAVLAWQWTTAFALVFVGSNAGANLMFLVARSVGPNHLRIRYAQQLKAFEERFRVLSIGNPEDGNTTHVPGARSGFLLILLLRLVPMSPFGIVSYAAGLSAISWRSYFAATLVGMLPGTLLFTYVGGHIDWTSAVVARSLEILLAGAVAVLGFASFRAARRHLRGEPESG